MAPRPGFLWADTGSIRIMMHGEHPPSDEEWQRFMAATIREIDGEVTFSERTGAVIYSRGGMATARQRNDLRRVDLSNSKRMPTLVLMTNSRIARGVATAIGWIVPALRDFHTFRLDQVDDVAQLLCKSRLEQQEFKAVLGSLLQRLDGEAPHPEPHRVVG